MDKLKNYLYSIAKKSSVRKWALSLTGWKWWVWQIVVGLLCFSIAEILLNNTLYYQINNNNRRINGKETNTTRLI